LLIGLVYTICEIYLDDVIIYGTGPDEFVRRTRRVFESFKLRRIRLKAKKTKLGHGQIEYVGKQISSKGLSMTPSKIRAFLDIPRPADVTSLHKFLGVGNYFRNFIQGHSTVAAGPLNRMLTGILKKRTSLTWFPEGIKAFDDLRYLIANCPLLHFHDETSPITLRTDASDYGIGGVLFQTVADIENPVAFVGKFFTEVQLRWSVIQKEAYAIFYCCTTLDYLLQDLGLSSRRITEI
jgi:RNase H-like domain found in reverse transcriptase